MTLKNRLRAMRFEHNSRRFPGHDQRMTEESFNADWACAGTTLLVAGKLGRDAIGIELKREYCEMIVRRCRDTFTGGPLLVVDSASGRLSD